MRPDRRKGSRSGPRSLVLLVLILTLAATGLSAPATAAPEEIRIIRDKYGVPHIFAKTRAGVAYGAGYALAQDRLWQMHVFRRIAKGRLSEIFGPPVVETDKTVNFFTYTEGERAARLATYHKEVQSGLQAFADGINAWIAQTRTDPSKLPLEFVTFGERAEDWTVDDSVALQDVLILSFGSGGGNELAHAQLLSDLIEQHGARQGCLMWNDLVVTEDPDSPMTIPRDYPYARRPTYGRDPESQSRRALQVDARLGLEGTRDLSTRLAANVSASSTASDAAQANPCAKRSSARAQLRLIPDVNSAVRDVNATLAGLADLRRGFSFGSNAQIVGPSRSKYRNSLQTGGPQVGYLLPQWLADFGLHGGGLEATGMTFAGAGPAVLIGRGRGYAWTTTTGASDLSDTYVEQLNPDNSREYLYKGDYEPMQCRTETYEFKGAVPFDEQEVCRTRHGPVAAFDEANGVAYSIRSAWFNREGQTVEGFFRFNEAKSLEDYATFSNYLASNHNMFYTDDRGNFGYWHPGNHVVRAPGVDLRLPQDGTGASEWRGLLPLPKVPHAVNIPQGFISNWNNQPAAGWQRERGHPAIDNSRDLHDVLSSSMPRRQAARANGGRTNGGRSILRDPLGDRFDPKGLINPDGLLDYEDMSANLRYAAFKHHNFSYFGPFLPAAKALDEGVEANALEVVEAWDGFLTDNDGDGNYDSAAPTIVDRWIALMREQGFADDLGPPSEANFSWGNTSLLWHLLASEDRLRQRFDWLGKASPREIAASAFKDAVAQLAEELGGEPNEWQQPVRLQHYTRINADTFTDIAEGEAGRDNSGDSGRPGDVRDHILMDRGTYNHVVVYLKPPRGSGVLGLSPTQAGSVIPPGQSGFIPATTAQEAAHYEDQLALYEEWGYKPMPMTLEEVLALKESEETITMPA